MGLVKHIIGLTALAACLMMSGCGFVNQIWGEAPPERKTVTLESDPLPAFETVFDDDQKVADHTLSLWKQNILDSFNQIEGSKKDFLSIDEASTLVRKGFVKLSPDRELSVKRAQAAMTLLGYKNGISLSDVKSLFAWLDANRAQAKTFYQMFLATNPKNDSWNSKDLVAVLQLFGSFIELGGDDSLSAKQMATLIDPWIPETYPHAKAAVESGINFGVSFFASFCGDRVESTQWNGKKIGVCIRDAADYFAPTGPVFDFLFGHYDPVRSKAELTAANAILVTKVQEWLKGHQHPLFPTSRVADFANSLSIPPPYHFFKLTEWLPKLNADSSELAFSPSFFLDLAPMIQNWITTFQSVTAKEKCTLDDWTQCEFKGEYEPVDQLYNAEYATLIRSKNLGFVNKIAFYDSIAKFLMGKLDTDHDQLLGDNIKDLIGIAIRLMDSNAFAYNVVQRIQEKPIDPSSAEESMKSIKRQGLAELAAFAADLIPERAKNKRSFVKMLQAQIYSNEKNLTYNLDQLGVTTFLYIDDLIGSLRADYLKNYDLPVRAEGSLNYVKRRKVVEALPRILFDHFPRIYNECLEWGFERTCGVVFTEVLPGPNEGRDDIETYEMDIVTLTSVLLESMMNRCDRNSDDRLSTNLFDGFDEKHCMINVSQALARRLMNANIIESDSKAELLMTLVKRVPFVRWVGKVALARGSAKGMGLRILPPFSLVSGQASLGSVLSLAAEFMGSDQVKAIEAGTAGPAEDPGDELLYFNQLTNHYLPSQTQALRPSSP
jgi:hypothetical protein